MSVIDGERATTFAADEARKLVQKMQRGGMFALASNSDDLAAFFINLIDYLEFLEERATKMERKISTVIEVLDNGE